MALETNHTYTQDEARSLHEIVIRASMLENLTLWHAMQLAKDAAKVSDAITLEPAAETHESGAGDALEAAILAVLADSDPLEDFEIREQLIEHHNLPDYTPRVVRDAIKRLNEAGTIVFRHDKYLNNLYYLNPHKKPTHNTPPPATDTAGGYTVERKVDTYDNGNDEIVTEVFWNVLRDGKEIATLSEYYNNNYPGYVIAEHFARLLIEETAILRSQLSAAHAHTAALEARVAELESEVAMHETLVSTSARVAELTGERDKYRDQLSAAAAHTAALEAERDTLADQLRQCNDAYYHHT